jgi:hypothetical protein
MTCIGFEIILSIRPFFGRAFGHTAAYVPRMHFLATRNTSRGDDAASLSPLGRRTVNLYRQTGALTDSTLIPPFLSTSEQHLHGVLGRFCVMVSDRVIVHTWRKLRCCDRSRRVQIEGLQLRNAGQELRTAVILTASYSESVGDSITLLPILCFRGIKAVYTFEWAFRKLGSGREEQKCESRGIFVVFCLYLLAYVRCGSWRCGFQRRCVSLGFERSFVDCYLVLDY